MFTLCHSTQAQSISQTHRHTPHHLLTQLLDHPVIVSFSSSFAYQISQNTLSDTPLTARVVFPNGAPLLISPLHKTLFSHQLSLLSQAQPSQIQHTYKMLQSNSLNSIPFSTIHSQFLTSCTFNAFIDQKLEIVFGISRPGFIMESNSDTLRQVISLFLSFLFQITPSIVTLLQRQGLIGGSLKQKMKNHREMIISKKAFTQIIKNQNQLQTETTIFASQPLSIKNPTGVFEQLSVVREERLDQKQMVFKRGGYFNIVKRKLLIQKTTNSINVLQYKNIAQKKLSKRKRPNTIFHYQTKIPKELHLLHCLNSLSLYELNYFAKYYLLVPSPTAISQSDEMLDESSENDKETTSTMSEESQVSSFQNVIYMDFYQENLEEYLARKGKLDIAELVHLIRQILQSVQSLHKVGIVHRDIKPANFMVEKLQDGQITIKLIDFGESSHMASNYDRSQILGFTIPYAPIECTYECKEGYNWKEIDLWSLGVLIFKLTTGRMPVSYSKCFKSDIKYEWPSSLAFFLPQYGRGRWSMVESMLMTLALMFLKVNPKQRLSIEKGMRFLDGIEEMARHFTYQL